MIIQDISILKQLPVGKSKDYTGLQLENCTVIKRVKPLKEIKDRCACWLCQCKCNNYFTTNSNYLQSHIKSGGPTCGCKQKQLASKAVMDSKGKPKTDLIGQKFGLLTVLSFSYIDQHRHSVWKCQCDCGTIKEISRCELTTGKVKSCGCLKQSFGSYLIQQILINNNIPFEKEKSFESCRVTKEKAKFDFYINNKLIQFDGRQHFQASGGFFTEQAVKKIQERDKYKNKWCEENHIPLIRIPYTDEKLLSLEYLQTKGVI